MEQSKFLSSSDMTIDFAANYSKDLLLLETFGEIKKEQFYRKYLIKASFDYKA